jgi:anti-anti-sigma factor
MSEEPHPHWFDAVPHGDVMVVRFTLDKIWQERTTQILGEELSGLMGKDCRHMVLNFARVESIGSVMLGKLNALRNQVQAAGGRLVLCRLNAVLTETFEVTRLSRLFTICGDEEEALQTLAALP